MAVLYSASSFNFFIWDLWVCPTVSSLSITGHKTQGFVYAKQALHPPSPPSRYLVQNSWATFDSSGTQFC